MPWTASRRRDLWLLFAFALVMLGAGIGLRDPWPADEPRFALVAKQMVDSGQYLIPHRGIELYSDKPPTFMWMQAAAFHLTGNWRIAFLLPSLLAALGTLALVYDLARRLATHRAGILAAAMLCTCIHFSFQAKAAQIDATITFWITLSAYGLLRHLLRGPDWRWWFIGWAAAGAGIITKGVGFLALLLLVPYAFARIRRWPLPAIPLRDWRWYAAPLALAGVVALWIVPLVASAYGGNDPALRAYADDLLFRQTASRYANPWHHVQPWWYYLPIVLLLWLPWSALLPWTTFAWARRWRRRDAHVLLPLAWAVLVVAFFSFSPGKRDVYILPVLPIACVATAPLLPGLLRKASVQRTLFALAVLIGGALAAGAAWAWLGEPSFEKKLAATRDIAPWGLVFAIGAVTLVVAAFARPRRGALAWATFAFALWTLYGFWGYPLLNDARSARGVMQRAGALIGSDGELALVAYKEQNLLLADRPVREWGFLTDWDTQRRSAVAWLQEAPGKRHVFILEAALGDCIDRTRLHDAGLANRRRWYVFGADAVIPGCVDTAKTGSYDPLDEQG